MPERCGSCGAPIVWAHNVYGKREPIDAAPVAGGNIVLVGLGEPPRAEHVKPGVGTHVSHFATCPDARKWRRRQ